MKAETETSIIQTHTVKERLEGRGPSQGRLRTAPAASPSCPAEMAAPWAWDGRTGAQLVARVRAGRAGQASRLEALWSPRVEGVLHRGQPDWAVISAGGRMRAADSLTNQTQAAAVPASRGQVRTRAQSPQQLDRKARPQETRIRGAQEPCKGSTRKDGEAEWPEKPSEDTHTPTTCCHRRAKALCTHYTCTHCVYMLYTQPGLYGPTEQSFSNSDRGKTEEKSTRGKPRHSLEKTRHDDLS